MGNGGLLGLISWFVPTLYWRPFAFACIGFIVVTILCQPSVASLLFAVLVALVIFMLAKPSKEEKRAAENYFWPSYQNQQAEAAGAWSLLEAFLTSAAMIGLILHPIGLSAKWIAWLLHCC